MAGFTDRNRALPVEVQDFSRSIRGVAGMTRNAGSRFCICALPAFQEDMKMVVFIGLAGGHLLMTFQAVGIPDGFGQWSRLNRRMGEELECILRANQFCLYAPNHTGSRMTVNTTDFFGVVKRSQVGCCCILAALIIS